MNDQAKRWTARGTFIASGDRDVAEAINRYTGEASEIATRLAACADLLRGVGELDVVAVMTGERMAEIRNALVYGLSAQQQLKWLASETGTGWAIVDAERLITEQIAALPVPPKGD